MEQRTLTNGEFKVGIGFNPGKHAAVEEIKRKAADLIDAIEKLAKEHRLELGRFPEGQPEEVVKSYNEDAKAKAWLDEDIVRRIIEVGRLTALSCTAVEHAAMDGVKAVTK